MFGWAEAGTLCEELYGVHMDTKEGFFICPECGEPVYEIDWPDHEDWSECPICGFCFEEG